ncbi:MULTISPECIES: hypothetical protein [Actinosynnema]|uniref:hypothetical protein n=1 Tax=Actinosynnema TaxID=40566 RepID=UPI0020A29D3E|nr:hypothetical protein [Actinosynnema pretiosum]MCP2098862.1 hypothetical protein [Actinosynnema pretiosum]
MENVTFANPGAVPAGSLALPAGAIPAPGVVMVGGSGLADHRLQGNGADPAPGYLNTLIRWITDRTTSPS